MDGPPVMHIGRLAKFIRRYYAPFLLKPMVKICVMIIFAGLFVLSVISMQYIQLGLGASNDAVICVKYSPH